MNRTTLTAGVLAALLLTPGVATCGVATANEVQSAPQQPRAVTVDFSQADIMEVLQAVAKEGELSVIVSGDVKSKPLEVHLKNVTPNQAIEQIATDIRLSWKVVDGTYFLGAASLMPSDDFQPLLSRKDASVKSLDIQFSDAPVRDVLSTMIEMSGGKAVVAVDVTERIAFLNLRGEKPENAFNKVCLAVGLTWQQDEDGTIYVENAASED